MKLYWRLKSVSYGTGSNGKPKWFLIFQNLCPRKLIGQNMVPLLIQEIFSCFIRNSTRILLKMQNIKKDRTWGLILNCLHNYHYINIPCIYLYIILFSIYLKGWDGKDLSECNHVVRGAAGNCISWENWCWGLICIISLITHFLDGKKTDHIVNVQLILSLQTEIYAKDDEMKGEQCEHYNILPLYTLGVKPQIMKFPEVVKMQLNYVILASFPHPICSN